jgi:hypothetical protein
MLAFALHVSGAGHALADVIACAQHEHHEEPDCSDDGKDCPPGCPDCHCTHGVSFLVMEALSEPYQFAVRVDFLARDDGHALSSYTFGIFRPPRA